MICVCKDTAFLRGGKGIGGKSKSAVYLSGMYLTEYVVGMLTVVITHYLYGTGVGVKMSS